MATPLDDAMRTDYQHALDGYEDAKQLVRVQDGAAAAGVTRTLEDARLAMASVLARQDGRELPAPPLPLLLRPGPWATADVEWAPPHGAVREIPVCFRCRERLTAGEAPGARWVQWGEPPGAVVPGGAGVRGVRRGLLRLLRAGRCLPGVHPARPVARPGGRWGRRPGRRLELLGAGGIGDYGFGSFEWGGWHGTGSHAGFGFDLGFDLAGGGDGGGGGGDAG